MVSVKPNRTDCYLFHYATVEHTKDLAKILGMKHILIGCDVADPRREANIIREVVEKNRVDGVVLGGVGLQVTQIKSIQDALLPLGVDIVITDDGLQHYALQRDIEIAVVDGNRRFGSEQLIPLGPLRETTKRLSEVDFIITNGGKAHENEAAMALTPSLAVNLKTREKAPVSQLEQLVAMAGIGHPPRFFNTLESLGASPVVTQGFSDHKNFEPSELQTLASRGQHLIMTEKDAVKCASYAEENWWYLPVTASFSPQDETRILSKIKEVKEKYGPSTA